MRFTFVMVLLLALSASASAETIQGPSSIALYQALSLPVKKLPDGSSEKSGVGFSCVMAASGNFCACNFSDKSTIIEGNVITFNPTRSATQIDAMAKSIYDNLNVEPVSTIDATDVSVKTVGKFTSTYIEDFQTGDQEYTYSLEYSLN